MIAYRAGVFVPRTGRSYPALGEDDYLAIIDRHFGYPKEDHRGERWPQHAYTEVDA